MQYHSYSSIQSYLEEEIKQALSKRREDKLVKYQFSKRWRMILVRNPTKSFFDVGLRFPNPT